MGSPAGIARGPNKILSPGQVVQPRVGQRECGHPEYDTPAELGFCVGDGSFSSRTPTPIRPQQKTCVGVAVPTRAARRGCTLPPHLGTSQPPLWGHVAIPVDSPPSLRYSGEYGTSTRFPLRVLEPLRRPLALVVHRNSGMDARPPRRHPPRLRPRHRTRLQHCLHDRLDRSLQSPLGDASEGLPSPARHCGYKQTDCGRESLP